MNYLKAFNIFSYIVGISVSLYAVYNVFQEYFIYYFLGMVILVASNFLTRFIMVMENE